MEIEAPEAFWNAVRNLGQDLLEEIESIDHMAQVVLIGVDPDEGAVIRSFIDQVLAQHYDAETLKKFWLDTPASIYFDDGKDVAALLQAVRERLHQPPYVNTLEH